MVTVATNAAHGFELDSVLRRVLADMRTLVSFRGGTICLVDREGVYVAASDPPVSESVANARVPVGTGLSGRCVATGEPVRSGDVTVDERVDPRLRTIGTNRDMRSYLAVPLVCLGDTIGVLQVDSTEVEAFGDEEQRLLQGLASQVAAAIESARRIEEMRRLDEARTTFIVRAGHELRTPLTVLRGFTSWMVEHPERFATDDEAREMLARLDQSASRLQVLVDELLSVSAFEAGSPALAPVERVTLFELLLAVRAASSRPSDVTIDCPTDLVSVVNPSLARRVLAPLVENALKYAGAAELHGAAASATRCAVSVVDHGPGIPDDQKQAVFDWFRRGMHTSSGWGLGLSVVVELAAALGTDVRVSDTPGGGATFSLLLPR